ncbi:hypothetical protein [Herbiconiux sp. VKM Ac-2851]|uniref:hypothetical protein n=1 Tax=Herbiconiux sp. VKM Ac-2851 TaxID=2739025 RepID=UPI001564C4EB|nr:hypothetical protein [Herbiconiux sp. VKM Ac-2851]NQX36269.1 hypothetical protein [Herbiconiux sp. VKM Ac-2851]
MNDPTTKVWAYEPANRVHSLEDIDKALAAMSTSRVLIVSATLLAARYHLVALTTQARKVGRDVQTRSGVGTVRLTYTDTGTTVTIGSWRATEDSSMRGMSLDVVLLDKGDYLTEPRRRILHPLLVTKAPSPDRIRRVAF